MDNKYVLNITLVLVFTFLMCAGTISECLAENHYILADATGNNDGTDWENARTDFQKPYGGVDISIVRGDTYYIADGSYPGFTAGDKYVTGDNSLYITIKKATVDDHGTDMGWDDSYGDGQAEFTASVRFRGYQGPNYIFDGVVGSGTSGYGFKVSTAPDGANKLIHIDKTQNVVIRHVDLEHRGNNTELGDDCIYAPADNNDNLVISYCYLHDVGRHPFVINHTNNIIIEHCYIARNQSTLVEHSAGISGTNVSNLIIRYNTWEDIEGTGCIVISDNVGDGRAEIYGNIFFLTSGFEGVGNGTITSWGDETFTNAKVYNNTFYNLKGLPGIAWYNTSTGNVAYNNLWYNCENFRLKLLEDHDYNALESTQGEDHEQILQASPFVNEANYDFRLISGTAPGMTLGSEYNIDMIGKTRGSDGIWDIGAFEFQPTIFSLSQNYPNPFNLITTIAYSLANDAYVNFVVYNIVGQKVAVLQNDMFEAGNYSIAWNAEGMPSGIYLYQLKANGFNKTKKMLLVK